jgi:hypothetical protein
MSMGLGMIDVQHTGDRRWRMPYHLSDQQTQALAQSSAPNGCPQQNQRPQFKHE